MRMSLLLFNADGIYIMLMIPITRSFLREGL